ncbi:MAG: type VI secretion protein IcmF/TssM N-terminal domain-containing protein, partial [Planctomycetota bacterium]
MSILKLFKNWVFIVVTLLVLVNLTLVIGLATESWVTGAAISGALFVALIVVAVVEVIIGKVRAKRLKKRIVDPTLIPGGESSDAMIKSFEDGIDRLSGKLGKDFLYTQPWFVIIGEPGSGKTTSIAESKIPLAMTDKQQGVGGTQNCDWWFTNDAVIIDIAGRLATKDTLKNVWEKFLLLLKKSRPRRPIDGVIVAIPADVLISTSEDQREKISKAERMAGKLKSRIAELREQLDVVFPIHILITKCDRMRGFEETFTLLPEPQKSTLFGWSNPKAVTADLDPNWIEQMFESVRGDIARVRNNEVLTPQNVRASANRILLFEEEFLALKPVLEVYLEELVRRDPGEESQLIRGVFLSSGGQDKLHMSSLFPSVSSEAEEEEEPEEETAGDGRSGGGDLTFELGGSTRRRGLWGRPYFVHDFYAKKVFVEKGLVRPTQKAKQKQNKTIQLAKIGAVV